VHLGSRLLQEAGGGVASIAKQVGYDSEAAFNRAFKRYMGQPPATWLRAAQA
jgi:AraC-like DNA-binding protein